MFELIKKACAGRSATRTWVEILTAARFALVGGVATVTHLGLIWLLMVESALPTFLANTLAFLGAFGVSFVGHYCWTFNKPGNPFKVIVRFMLIALLGFFVNTSALAFLLKLRWLSAPQSSVVAVALVPVITFLGSRLWGFKRAKSAKPAPTNSIIR